MREIKFRAWDNVNKRMLMFDKGFSQNDEYDLLCIEGDRLDVPVGDNLNFMQYSGLKDKNGKEIYEGDIVQSVSSKQSWEIGFREGSFGLVDSRYNKEFLVSINPLPRYLERYCEVIGNIYENPELLEKEQ